MDNYLDGNDHIGGDDPTAFMLRRVAEALDKKFTIAMVREYRGLVNTLRRMEPEKPKEEDDPLLAPVYNMDGS